MSFASRFAEGARVAQGLIDTYDKAKLQRDIADVAAAKPVETENFTPQDDEQIQRAKEAVNPDTGQPYYDVSASEDGYRIGLSNPERASTALAGGDANMGGLVRPKAVTTFLGKTYEGKLDDSRLNSLRQRGLVDVMTRNNPLDGMRLNAALDDADAAKVALARADKVYDRQEAEWVQKDALKNATVAVQEAKTPEELKQARASLLAIPGGLEALDSVQTSQAKVEQRLIDVLYNKVSPLARSGDVAGLVKAYSHYNDGMDARQVEGRNEIQIVDEKTGDVVQTIAYKDGNDLDNILWKTLYPGEARKIEQRAAAEANESRRKVLEAGLIEQAKMAVRGEYGQLRGQTSNESSSTGRRGDEAAPKSMVEQAVADYRTLAKDNGKDTATPGSILKVSGYIEQLHRHNPGITSPTELAVLADHVANNESKLAPAFTADGVPMMAIESPSDGTRKYFVRPIDTRLIPGAIKTELTNQAEQFMKGIVGEGNRDLAIRAFKNGGEAMNQLSKSIHDSVIKEVEKAKADHEAEYRRQGKKAPYVDRLQENSRIAVLVNSRLDALRRASPFFTTLPTRRVENAAPEQVNWTGRRGFFGEPVGEVDFEPLGMK